MSEEITYVELPKGQQKVANELLRRFTTVFILAFAVEISLRLSPNVLKDLPERDWLEWLIVSLLGVSAYLLWNIAIWHSRKNADFIAYRPWYRATAARGPVLALVVMIALTSVNFQLASTEKQTSTGVEVETESPEGEQPSAQAPDFELGVNFGNASDTVLLVAAFVLGFYSRLANDVLGRIAQFLFKGIYEETYEQELSDDDRDNEDKKGGGKSGK